MNQEEKHLTVDQIEGLIETRPGTSDGHALEEVRLHLTTCKACQKLVEIHHELDLTLRELKQGAPNEATSYCPPSDSLNRLAVGLVLPEEAEQLLSHVLECDHCMPMLREATEALSQEDKGGEAKLLSSLQSSKPEWQSRMARMLASRDSPERMNSASVPSSNTAAGFWNALRNPWVYAFVTAALVMAITSWFVLSRRSGPSYATQLLAQAYTAHRTLEVRIPGANYAPLRIQRGYGSSSLERPASLLKAETLIVEGLRESPNDPRWLEAKARADLLDGNYESAIKTLQRTLETQQESPQLLTDLGSGYFLRAEAADRSTDYGNAIETLSKGLAKSPDDSVALFNRALAFERMFLYSQAVDDWEHYLRLDRDGDWANEARINLQRVKQKLADREKQSSMPLLSPKAFVATIYADHVSAVAQLDGRIEQYLEMALHSWLPQTYASSANLQGTRVDSRRALQYLANILEQWHDDDWLVDFLGSPPSPVQDRALRSLLAGEDALHNGRYGQSAELYRDSERDFELSGNHAGMLRAEFDRMLAQSFALRYSDCLRTATGLVPSLSTSRYRWLQAQSFIQRGLCQDAMEQEDEAIRSTRRGAEIAKHYHYPGLELRATAFEAAYSPGSANGDQRLHSLIDGLETFWHTEATNTRGENLYSVLFSIAGTRDWHYVEAASMAEKIRDFPARDPVDQAVALEILAGAQERAGDYKAAQETLQTAMAHLASLPEDGGTVLRKAEMALDSAAIQLQLGDAKGASTALAKLRPQFEAADTGLFQAEYFETYGEAYVALGLSAQAEPLLTRALSVTEIGLVSLKSEADKLQWSRIEGQVYRDLVAIKLKTGLTSEAFALWESYKGASLRAAVSKRASALVENAVHSPSQPFASSYALASGTTVVSYVLLKKSATAFVFSDGNLRSYELQIPDGANLRARHFLELCADPSADSSSFDAESRRLYGILISPLESDIKSAKALRFETDGILDGIPFDLLRGPDGGYLADRFEVSYSLGLAYKRHLQLEPITRGSAALIVLATATQDSAMGVLPEANEEGKDVSSYFREATILSGSQATRANVLRSLQDAQLFHFIGHGVAGVDKVGLILGPEMLLDSRDLVSLPPRKLKLAVLSACDTANGEDGTYSDVGSLARTFVVLGVPQTVASRWKVDSRVTRQLMERFYWNLMAGKSPADSLHAATLEVRSLPGYEHPYYWGSFAVFGTS